MAKKQQQAFFGPVNGLGGAVTPSNTVGGLAHGRKPKPGYIVDDVTIAAGQFAGAYAEYVTGATANIIAEPLVEFLLPAF